MSPGHADQDGRPTSSDEEHFVRRTADFPDLVDLEDVLATHGDHVEYLDA